MLRQGNYFDLFSIKPVFSLDLADLRERYFALQREVHPDRFANTTDQERLSSVHHTSYVNAAYTALKDPVKRACYLLETMGVVVDFENNTQMSASFLMEQMEWRESLEALHLAYHNGAEAAFNRKAFDELVLIIDHAFVDRLNTLTRVFINYPFVLGDAVIEQSLNLIRELVFLKKIKEELDVLEDEFD